MLKRIGTLLLGLGLVGLGVLLFLAPEHSRVVRWLMVGWPLFLVLAGLVRTLGFLLDRHPRSPAGGLLIAALGGILFFANLRGESSLLILLGRYWFWLLLAYVLGRVLRQYGQRGADGKPVRAFSAAGIFGMVLIAGAGLGAHYATRSGQVLAQLNARVSQLGEVGAYVFGNPIIVNDEPAQTFTLPPNARLSINDFKGNVEIHGAPVAQASARLSKSIRAANEEQARAIAQNLRLQLTTAGNVVQIAATTEGVTAAFTNTLIVELPNQTDIALELADISGAVTLNDLRGEHSLRNSGVVTVGNQQGKLTIDNPRNGVRLTQINGEVALTNLRAPSQLQAIAGKLTLAAHGGNHTLSQINGPLRLALTNAQLELRDARSPQPLPANEPLVAISETRDSRLRLQNITGATVINAVRTRLDADTLTGNLTINNSAEPINLARLVGQLRVTTDNGAVSVRDLFGAGEIAATQDITVQNFNGALKATTRLGRLKLSHNGELGGDLNATSEHGQIKLNLPDDIAFRLDAATTSGRLRARGFDDIDPERKQKVLTARHTPAAHAIPSPPLVSLRTISGNIELQASGQALARRDKR